MVFVQDVMTPKPLTVNGDTHVKAAVQLPAQRQVSSLPAVDARGRSCGVVSEADLIRDSVPPDIRAHLLPHEDAARTPARLVSEVMSNHAVTVHETTDQAEAAELMTSTSIKGLPVVDDEHRVVGIVSRSDVIRARARADDVLEREVDSVLVSLGHSDWLVEAREGMVGIEGPKTPAERSLAAVAANSVAGVVSVRVH